MEKRELKAQLEFNGWIDMYIQIMNGVNGVDLSCSETDLLKMMIIKYFELKKTLMTDKAIFDIVFSTNSRKEYRTKQECNQFIFNNRILGLRKKGLIIVTKGDKKTYSLNSKILPVKELTFKFEILDGGEK